MHIAPSFEFPKLESYDMSLSLPKINIPDLKDDMPKLTYPKLDRTEIPIIEAKIDTVPKTELIELLPINLDAWRWVYIKELPVSRTFRQSKLIFI